jgi:hypothetical protein
MSPSPIRIAISALFFLFIFLSGFWLSRLGKPLNTALFTIHKLIALGAVVFLAVTIYNIQKTAPLSQAQMILSAAAALCFVATFATGGLLSVDKVMPVIVLRLHQVAPYLTLLSTSAALYLILAQ